MIHAIHSSLPSFKTLAFRDGLNILLAERTPDSTEHNTRNSAGKSSMVEIIHFLLGANVDSDSIFRTETLKAHDFFLDVDLPYGRVVLRRKGAEPASTYVFPENLAYPVRPVKSKYEEAYLFPTKLWRRLLGPTFFGLPLTEEKFSPSPRSLLNYFARRERPGGIIRPERSSSDQQRWDIQVNLSFLFGLDYRLPSELQNVREQEAQLAKFKDAAKSGAFRPLVETTGQLRPKLAEAHERVRRLEERLRGFRVEESYAELVHEASQHRQRLRELFNEDLIDQDRLAQLRDAVSNEADASEFQVLEMFSELRDLFSQRVRRELAEVQGFHESVSQNRRADLAAELEATESRIRHRKEEAQQLDRRRADILLMIDGAGGLDEFVSLQAELSSAQQEAVRLQVQFDSALFLESRSTGLELARKEIEQRTRADHVARDESLSYAALVVRELVSALYDDRKGNLFVQATNNGPEFRIVIEGDRGGGISAMEIWAFDMLLSRLSSERNIGPHFLIHDSHVFDGVDARQVTAALKIGAEYSGRYGFQYIVTMNSDEFERLKPDAPIENSVMDTVLNDQRDDGGIFGCIIEDRRLDLRPAIRDVRVPRKSKRRGRAAGRVPEFSLFPDDLIDIEDEDLVE